MNEQGKQTGERLKKLLKRLRINQVRLAEIIGSSPQFLNAVATGRKRLTGDMAHRIAEALPVVNPDWLLNGVGEMLLPGVKMDYSAVSGISQQVNEPDIGYPEIRFDDLPRVVSDLLRRVKALEIEMESEKRKKT